MEYPREWDDDQIMTVLFSPFRERSVNPVSYDKKLKFWSGLIFDYSKSTKKIKLDIATLESAFKRHGRLPLCLPTVFNQMAKTGQLISREHFQLKSNDPWLKWGFNILVKNPTNWAFGALVKSPMTWTYGKVFGSNSLNAIEDQEYINVELLKESADMVFLDQQSIMENDRTDCIIGFEELRRRYNALIPDDDDFHLVLMQLCNDNRCSIFTTEHNDRVVRFAKKNKRSVTPSTEQDTKIYKLKLAESMLESQLQKLDEEMERLRTEAKHFLSKGQTQSAKSCLRKKKRYEMLRSKKQTSLENLQHILFALQQADSHKLVLDAYSSGSAAFRDLQAKHGLDRGSIDDVMTDLEQTFEDNDEMNRSMASMSLTDDLDPELADLEDELDAILAEAEENDGETRSPSNVRVPQVSGQAAAGAGDQTDPSRLKVTKPGLFELPDVPTFDPLHKPRKTTVTSQYRRQHEPAT